jgi:DNA-directed RNA polymerase subunit RPC12/RpoP
MPVAAFACPKCARTFSVEEGTAELNADCPDCASHLLAYFFPAFYRPEEAGTAAAAVVDPTEASCFYHPQKQAARVCAGCGRLVCSLCSIDMGTQHLCPACISSGQKKAKITALEPSRTRFDNIALGLAIASLFMSFFSLILSPAAMYIVVRYWKNPGGLQGRGHIRMGIAFVLALGSLVLWTGMLALVYYGATTGNHHHAQPR